MHIHDLHCGKCGLLFKIIESQRLRWGSDLQSNFIRFKKEEQLAGSASWREMGCNSVFFYLVIWSFNNNSPQTAISSPTNQWQRKNPSLRYPAPWKWAKLGPCKIPSQYFSFPIQPKVFFINSLTHIAYTLTRRLSVILCQWSHGFGPQEWIEMDPHVSL